jgi:peroxiredoxin
LARPVPHHNLVAGPKQAARHPASHSPEPHNGNHCHVPIIACKAMDTTLPAGLPVPVDDGAASHLRGAPMPALSLPATDGSRVSVQRPPEGFSRLVLYAYPKTGRPGEPELTPDWDSIPGARGCTPEACGFRDHAEELAQEGAAVAGVSTQTTEEQGEVVDRLGLPFPLLSDANQELAKALRLPTFDINGHVLLKRLTLIVHGGVVEKAFYPVFPPDSHAEEVLGWLRSQPL